MLFLWTLPSPRKAIFARCNPQRMLAALVCLCSCKQCWELPSFRCLLIGLNLWEGFGRQSCVCFPWHCSNGVPPPGAPSNVPNPDLNVVELFLGESLVAGLVFAFMHSFDWYDVLSCPILFSCALAGMSTGCFHLHQTILAEGRIVREARTSQNVGMPLETV